LKKETRMRHEARSAGMARRDFLRAAGMSLAGITVLGVAGCGDGGGESASGEVTFWVPSVFREVEIDAMKRIVGNFNDAGSEARVKMVRVSGDVTDASKLMTAVRGGKGPDAYLLDRFTVAQRAADGVLEPLDAFGAHDLEDQYLESAWDEVMFDSKPYALPFDGGVHGGLFYRKDVLEEAGVDLEEFQPENGPITVERLREAASSLDRTEGDRYTRLGFVPWLSSGFPYTWGFDFGGEFFDPESCEVTPTDPAIVQAFQTMYYDWAEEKGPGKVQEFVNTYLPPGGNPAQDPFFTGRLPMLISGDFYLPNISRYARDLDYGITYLPVP
jgi:multiple sugar transport system substrate-binding protein